MSGNNLNLAVSKCSRLQSTYQLDSDNSLFEVTSFFENNSVYPDKRRIDLSSNSLSAKKATEESKSIFRLAALLFAMRLWGDCGVR